MSNVSEITVGELAVHKVSEEVVYVLSFDTVDAGHAVVRRAVVRQGETCYEEAIFSIGELTTPKQKILDDADFHRFILEQREGLNKEKKIMEFPKPN